MTTETCEWKQINKFPDWWGTGCNDWFWMQDNRPSLIGMKFCCYCGKPIVVKEEKQDGI